MEINQLLSNRKTKDVYEWVRKQAKVSKQELMSLSGLTSTTLTRVLEELTTAELIVETGLGESTGGRRPLLYEINATYAYAFGLDISRAYSRLVLCDLQLRVLDTHIWRMDQTMTPGRLVGEAVQVITQMLDKHGLSHDRAKILGLGVGAVGPLDRNEGVILDPSYFPAPGWLNVKICEELQQRLAFPVWLDNGANTAILSEYWLTSNRSYEHLLYIHAGIGIRTSIIMGGNIVYGAVDMEGSVGQMIIQSDGVSPRDESGNFGSWESYASIHALEQALLAAIKMGRKTSVKPVLSGGEGETYSLMVKELHQNDPLVKGIFEQAACYFGIGLANMLNILHPEKVILGGPLFSGNPFFFEKATEVAIKRTYHSPRYKVMFSPSILGEDAVAVGAAVLVINQLTL